MRHWTLGARLAAWSALVVFLAILLCGASASYAIYRQAIRDLDGALRIEGKQFEIEQREAGAVSDWSQRDVKQLRPFLRKNRFVEITGPDGRTLFRSNNLHGQTLTAAREPFSEVTIKPEPVRVGVFRENDFTLYLGASLDEINDLIERLDLALLGAVPFVIGAVIAGGYWIARKALEPIQAITTATKEITAERLDMRLAVPAVQDEIGQLTTVLNEMLERLEKAFRQAVRFTADASHELKTPMTILRAGIEDVMNSPGLDPEAQRAVGALLEQTRRLSSITESLLLLSRADAGQLRLDLRPANVGEIIQACADDARILAEPRKIEIATEVASPLGADVDAGRLTQILLNLLDNAVKYNRDAGEVKVSAKQCGGVIRITVANTGPGLSPQHAAHIFERFYRFDPRSENVGAGLGLNIARELALAHGGDLKLVKSDAAWTEFRLTLGGEDSWSRKPDRNK